MIVSKLCHGPIRLERNANLNVRILSSLARNSETRLLGHDFVPSISNLNLNGPAKRLLASLSSKSKRPTNKRFNQRFRPNQNRPKNRSPMFADMLVGNQVNRTLRDLWRPLSFTAGVCGVSYVAAVVIQHEHILTAQRQLAERAMQRLGQRWDELAIGKNYDSLIWRKFSRGEQLLYSLIGLNVVVFGAWHMKALAPFMNRYFLNGFYTKSLCAPMVLSAFSHYSLIHLGLNMYVLNSFATPMINRFFAVEEFTAFYLSAACVSSLAGLTHKAIIGSRVCALGASGAILACLTYTCMKAPDSQLSIIFLPMFTFSAANAVIGIIAMDAAGLVFGFRLFDHAAHLGGSLFGVWYAQYGQHYLWHGKLKTQCINAWERIKLRLD